jgi:hypothetical protein
MADRFAISFHETFSLSRPSLAQIIGNAERSGALNRQFLVDTSLGTNYQKAMPRYAFRAGLLDERNNLSIFGHFAVRLDPALEKPATQWLLHYHLAAPHGPTAFWHHLVRKRFLPGNTFTTDDLIADLTEFLSDAAGKAPALRSIRSTVTIFTGTYLKIDGLRQLGLLEEVGPNTYRVPAAGPPPFWAVGYALAEYWHARYGERLTINLDDLTQGDFAAVFLLGEERLTQLLIQLKQEGMLDLYRISRPYQVVLLQPSIEYTLQQMYQM